MIFVHIDNKWSSADVIWIRYHMFKNPLDLPDIRLMAVIGRYDI